MKKISITIFWLALPIIFIFSRVFNLSSLPLFTDEAFAILEAKRLHEGGGILSMVEKNTQPIFIWIVSVFQFLPMRLLISGRIVSGFCGLITAGLLALLAHRYIGNKSAVLAFVLTTFLPFSLFYDRTILFESATLLWMTMALIFPLITPLAILTKLTGWLVLPLVLFENRKNLKLMFLTLFVTVSIPFLVWLLSVGNISMFSSTVFRQQQHLSFEIDTVRMKNNLFRTKTWLEIYITIPIICLTVMGWLLDSWRVVCEKKMTFLTTLGIWFWLVIIFEVVVGRTFYPRYLYPLVIPIALLAAKGWSSIFLVIDRFTNGKIKNTVMKIFASLLCLYPAIMLDKAIIFYPVRAPIAAEDRFQFFEDWTSGIGAQEISTKVEEIVQQKGLPVSVYTESDNSYLVALIDNTNLKGVKIESANWLADPLKNIPGNILQEKEETLFVRNLNSDVPVDWQVEKLLSVNKTSVRKVVLYRIVK